MSFKSILVEKKNNVLIIKLNEPDKRNALTLNMRDELLLALKNAEDDEEVKCIILTGEGRGFSSGGDLSVIKDLKPLEGRKRLQSAHPLIFKILEMEKPIIAAVNGAAAGAGFSILLLCDIIISSEKAFFVQSFVHVGLVPDFAALHFLPMLIGPQRAKEIMFLGERIQAKEAYQLGIINRIVPGDELLEESLVLAQNIASKAPNSIGFTKKLMNENMNRELRILLEMEAQAQDICYQTEDFKEGVQAFFEKRTPRFKGK